MVVDEKPLCVGKMSRKSERWGIKSIDTEGDCLKARHRFDERLGGIETDVGGFGQHVVYIEPSEVGTPILL